MRTATSVIMAGLFSFFGCSAPQDRSEGGDLSVDLREFRCGSTALGEKPRRGDVFFERFGDEEVYRDESRGIELGIADDVLDYVFVTVGDYTDRFTVAGEEIAIGPSTTEADILREFGDPYWRDDDDDEVILFYEDGRVELQFEFPHKRVLGYVTIMLSPLMADPEQRAAYGVDKPWPPAR